MTEICRTAPATPGLLKTFTPQKDIAKKVKSFIKKIWFPTQSGLKISLPFPNNPDCRTALVTPRLLNRHVKGLIN